LSGDEPRTMFRACSRATELREETEIKWEPELKH